MVKNKNLKLLTYNKGAFTTKKNRLHCNILGNQFPTFLEIKPGNALFKTPIIQTLIHN